jgi:hypothetical protein
VLIVVAILEQMGRERVTQGVGRGLASRFRPSLGLACP